METRLKNAIEMEEKDVSKRCDGNTLLVTLNADSKLGFANDIMSFGENTASARCER